MPLPLRAIGLCSCRCSGSTCPTFLHTRSLGTCYDLFGCLLHPAWDLSKVLQFLNSDAFEPLHDAPLRALSKKVFFLLALATAKRVGELQTLSRIVSFVGDDACLSYVPEFVAKSKSLTRFIPCSFLGQVVVGFCGGLGR